MARLSMTPRAVAVASELQVLGLTGPDDALTCTERILFALDRAAMRGHNESGPTEDEVRRAGSALGRRGISTSPSDVYVALFAALNEGGFAP